VWNITCVEMMQGDAGRCRGLQWSRRQDLGRWWVNSQSKLLTLVDAVGAVVKPLKMNGEEGIGDHGMGGRGR
jgi:hypothetical protein